MDVTDTVIGVVGGLAIFLFGMKVMSEGLQKVAGARMRAVLSAMTTNRFLGVATGLLVTSAVQSSSATTVMLVGFVHAGLINLSQAIGVIMGANIGTTFTGWLVALLGFKIHIAAMALPAIAIGFFVRFTGSRRLTDWGVVLVGFGLLFLGLDFMKDAVGHLKESPTIISWMSSVRADTIPWRLAAVGVGTAVTLVVQSSSATMAVTMTLAAQGLIDLPTACALVLGENIGTTVTANIAAIGASTTARRAARAHFLFNVFGALWAILLFAPFVSFIEAIVPGGDGAPSEVQLAAQLAAFHTSFNVINTGLFLPLVRPLGWLATKLVRERREEQLGLKYIDPRLMSSPPMALHAARSELGRMLDEVIGMLGRVLDLAANPKAKQGPIADRVYASEQIVDMLEKEISEYLVAVTRLETSFEESREIRGILHAVSDVERMGDHCESLAKLLGRKYDGKVEFSEHAHEEIAEIGARVQEFLVLIRENLGEPARDVFARALQLEQSVNAMRDKMREGHVERLQQGACDVASGLIFLDMLTSFEKLGDHAFNVAEMIAGKR